MRKFIAIFTAICAVFAFTGMAMAANRVEVKVTSEPIGYQATCDKAGGFSLEFDTGTVLTSGDRITIDLDYESTTNYVAICKEIDLEISAGGSTGEFTTANVPDDADAGYEGGVIYYYDDGGDADLADDGGNGIYFHVSGSVADQRITLDVLGTGSLTVGDDAEDRLVLMFLDQKNEGDGDFLVNGMYTDADGDGTYSDVATLGDNTLCINVSAWTYATVDANMDSKDDKFTFIPSDPQVAHIRSASTLSFASCSGKGDLEVGRVTCGSTTEDNGVTAETCEPFDFETADGYVSGTHTEPVYAPLVQATMGNRIIIETDGTFDVTDYYLELTILVNGEEGDNGVYFTSDALTANAYASVEDACDDLLANTGDLSATAGAVQPALTYETAAGAAASPQTVAEATDECDVDAAARAVVLTTATSTMAIVADDEALVIDLPYFTYDLDDIATGDEITLQVKLVKAPCGEIFNETTEIGTMCAEPSSVVDETYGNTVIFPYFSAMSGDNYWDGLVVTNMTSTEASFTALVYEKDGDMGAFTGTIPAMGMYLTTLSAALSDTTIVTSTGSGVMGDSQCYIVVCTDSAMADGCGFMGTSISNVATAGNSMAYIPRVDYYNSNDDLSLCYDLEVVAGELP